MLMKTAGRLTALLLVLTVSYYGHPTPVSTEDSPSTPALNKKLGHFDLTDATIIDGLSKLSDEPIAGLHLGIEEIIQDKSFEPPDRSIRFSLRLDDLTVGDILDMLCKSDRRYVWSVDGSSVNVHPRETIGNSSYLPNRELESISLKNINGPADALTPLMKLVPGEQLGYAGIGMGINNDYPEPWNTVFNKLTVRQLMNRLSEHNGPRGGWIWSGSRGQRFFAFFERGFRRDDRELTSYLSAPPLEPPAALMLLSYRFSRSGGTGRRSRLKICRGSLPVWVRLPPPGPSLSPCAL
jgi:hypothetical protein